MCLANRIGVNDDAGFNRGGRRPGASGASCPRRSAPVVVKPVLSTTQTAAGQPIVLPDDPQVLVSTYDIAPGAKLAVHKHPFPRYAYVLSGRLRVTYQETGTTQDYAAGAFIVEMLDAWHFGEAIGSDPVRLLVIDQVEEGRSNTVLKTP